MSTNDNYIIKGIASVCLLLHFIPYKRYLVLVFLSVFFLSSCATDPNLKQVKGFCDADVLKYKLRTDELFLEIYCKETNNN